MSDLHSVECVATRSHLNGSRRSSRAIIMAHLEACATCRLLFENQDGAFEALLGGMSGLPNKSTLAEAAQRLDGPSGTVSKTGPPVPAAIPGYTIENQISCTRHSQIFQARQVDIGRSVALKFVSTSSSWADANLLAHEGPILGSLRHPNILTIYQTGHWPGGIWLALEYCSKGSLANRLASGDPLPPRESATLVATIASAVVAAHRVGVIHGDIKPANILFATDGRPMLADFGLARPVAPQKKNGPIPSGRHPRLHGARTSPRQAPRYPF